MRPLAPTASWAMSHLSRDLKRSGELAYAKVEKVNSELFSLTYGAVVMQVLQDYEDVDATNAQLEKMSAPSPCRAQSHRAAPCTKTLLLPAWRSCSVILSRIAQVIMITFEP